MEYKVTMPILSDTMDYGVIAKWYVNVGDEVKKGDKLAEIESDKATMDIESFYDGVIKEILAKENEEVKVKSVIAIIDTNKDIKISKPNNPQPKKEIKKLTPKVKEVLSFIKSDLQASPLAKNLAKKYNIKLPKLAHEKDVIELIKNRYFTPKAKKFLDEYKIDFEEFDLDRKYNSNDILEYIKSNNLAKIIPLTPNQQAVIKNVENSIKKPTFFVFETLEIKSENFTPKIIKAFALAMQQNPLTRAILEDNKLKIYPNSNISIAVQREEGLFMCVIKEVENKSIEEIKEWLKEIKTKKLTIDDISGSTFGISNLGMFDIDSFTALINDKDSGICAIGSIKNNKVKLNFTIDHRILNGVDVAKFVNSIKQIIRSKNV